MQHTDTPTLIPRPFADAGAKRAVPTLAASTVAANQPSLELGFPNVTMIPKTAGGIPPAGPDFNGVFNLLSAANRYAQAGGMYPFNAAFSTAIGGYPKGALLLSSDGSKIWKSTAENNATDPDGASPVGWRQIATLDDLALYTGLDGSGTVSASNVTKLNAVAALGNSFRLPPPAVSYYLASNPTIPANVLVDASPHWFSGPGKMPAHIFAELSEGVDPRVFAIPDLTYSQTPPSNTKRVWSKAGWVKVGTSPAAGYEGTQTDAVGVDGRAVVTADKGRGWALVGLAQMESGPTDASTQAYVCELDMNNNDAHVSAFDAGKATRGLVVASGGSKRPAEAMYVMATYPMLDAAKDNRWFCGLRFLPTSFYKYGIFFQDGAVPQAGTGGANISLCYGGKIEFRAVSGPAPSVRSDADQVLWTLGNGGMTWRNSADSEYVAELSNAGVFRAKHLAAGMTLITDTSTASALDATQGGQIQLQPGSARTITTITTVEDQQIIWLLFLNGNTTVSHNASIQLAGHANYTPTAGSTLTLMRWGTVMREISRTVY